jgi:hypothetical protein
MPEPQMLIPFSLNWAEVERRYVKGHRALGMDFSSICGRT